MSCISMHSGIYSSGHSRCESTQTHLTCLEDTYHSLAWRSGCVNQLSSYLCTCCFFAEHFSRRQYSMQALICHRAMLMQCRTLEQSCAAPCNLNGSAYICTKTSPTCQVCKAALIATASAALFSTCCKLAFSKPCSAFHRSLTERMCSSTSGHLQQWCQDMQ